MRARLTEPALQSIQTAALKIVVVEGEGGVNIIEQKTAVAPVIEVRDRNDQPVSGAVVKFAIQKGKASFDGARTLTVTTNAAGRATATGLTAGSRGALQIAASAAFQGQTAAATIAQTTVATAAEASSIASGASAAGAGGSGGLSATTVAIVGGAAAGAVVTAKKLLDSGVVYRGTYSGPLLQQLRAANGSMCTETDNHSGTVEITLTSGDADSLDGTAKVNGSFIPAAGSPICGANTTTAQNYACGCSPTAQVSGTRTGLSVRGNAQGNLGSAWSYQFSGTFDGTQITGSFTLIISSPIVTASASFPTTLQRQ